MKSKLPILLFILVLTISSCVHTDPNKKVETEIQNENLVSEKNINNT